MEKLVRFLEKHTKAKMTQADIARELGVSPSLVSYWMAGTRKPGRDKIKQLSKLTGIPVEDLL